MIFKTAMLLYKQDKLQIIKGIMIQNVDLIFFSLNNSCLKFSVIITIIYIHQHLNFYLAEIHKINMNNVKNNITALFKCTY